LIASTIYSLRIMQKVFFGKSSNPAAGKDLTVRETIIMAVLVIAIVLTGLLPQPVIDNARPAVQKSLKEFTGRMPLTGIDKTLMKEADERH
jgi:NADH-quinone oxidoreductase subunit M